MTEMCGRCGENQVTSKNFLKVCNTCWSCILSVAIPSLIVAAEYLILLKLLGCF